MKQRSSRFNTIPKAEVYQIIQSKLILCSHYRSRYKGLHQNKKHGFDQYTKGGHFCAVHMALTSTKQPTLFFEFYCVFIFAVESPSVAQKKPKTSRTSLSPRLKVSEVVEAIMQSDSEESVAMVTDESEEEVEDSPVKATLNRKKRISLSDL